MTAFLHTCFLSGWVRGSRGEGGDLGTEAVKFDSRLVLSLLHWLFIRSVMKENLTPHWENITETQTHEEEQFREKSDELNMLALR